MTPIEKPQLNLKIKGGLFCLLKTLKIRRVWDIRRIGTVLKYTTIKPKTQKDFCFRLEYFQNIVLI